MFILIRVRDNITVPCHKLKHGLLEALISNIDEKYTDKVIPNSGLVMGIYDVVQVIDKNIFPGHSDIYVYTEFRLMVFRPAEGEMLRGKLVAVDEHLGLRVSLGYFSDIFVTVDDLPSPSTWVPEEKTFNWDPDTGYGGVFFDKQCEMVCVVQSVHFDNTSQSSQGTELTPPKSLDFTRDLVLPGAMAVPAAPSPDVIDPRTNLPCVRRPMFIKAVMNLPGCGNPAWWATDDDGAEAEGEEEQGGDEDGAEAMAE